MSNAILYSTIPPATSSNNASDAVSERLSQAEAILSLMLADNAFACLNEENQSDIIYSLSSLVEDAHRFYKHQMKTEGKS